MVGTGSTMNGMQLATDGKIYIGGDVTGTRYLNVIHKPSEKGIDCEFEQNAVDLFPGEGSARLPNILPDYLYRFVWEGMCESETFHFEPLVPAYTNGH